MTELENHHLATTTLIIALGKNHQQKPTFVEEFAKEHDTRSQTISSKIYLVITKGKIVTLLWRNPADAMLTEWVSLGYITCNKTQGQPVPSDIMP